MKAGNRHPDIFIGNRFVGSQTSRPAIWRDHAGWAVRRAGEGPADPPAEKKVANPQTR